MEKINPRPKLIQVENNVLELAYNSLNRKKQVLISKLSAFRNPIDYDAISIFNDFDNEEKFKEALNELVNRGMLIKYKNGTKFDLHPMIRKYCYDRLKGKKKVHSNLMDYFALIPKPKKIESVDNLAPAVELYYHTVKAGRYDEAVDLFQNRFYPLYLFGANQIIIELLHALFSHTKDKLPLLKNESDQGWVMNSLANSYNALGQLNNAVIASQIAINLADKLGNKKNVAIGLANLALKQITIGRLDLAESTLMRTINICKEIKDEFTEALYHHELSLIFVYRGEFKKSEQESILAMNMLDENAIQPRGTIFAICSFRALIMSNVEEAIDFAKKACKTAKVSLMKGDIIYAEYLLGTAHLMGENLLDAEMHLNEALSQDRKINLVEFEPQILLEHAKLRFKENRKEEALNFANEALQIADRCEFRLQQADIHNFLTQFYLDAGDLKKAREYGEIAKERAECGYKPALEKAENLLKDIEIQNAVLCRLSA